MHSCISPGAEYRIYCKSESQFLPIFPPPPHALPLLCYKSQLLHPSLFSPLFFFVEQFTLPCSQPATLASEEAEWGEAWALCTSVSLTPLLHPPPLSREYWVSRQSCTEQAEQSWEQSRGGEGATCLPPFYIPLWLGTGPWQCVVSLT